MFLNIVEAFADKKDNKIEIAIIVSSVVFGLGHIPGMLGMGIGVIIFKVISTIGMGFYFGTIYKKRVIYGFLLLFIVSLIYVLCHIVLQRT